MKKETWRERYLRLLRLEINGDEEYLEFDSPKDVKALFELEKAEYVRCYFIINETGTPQIAHITGPTLKGRIFAEDIEDWIEEHSTWARIKDLFKWLGAWIVGIATAIIIHFITG